MDTIKTAHIAVDVVALTAIAYYVTAQNKRLQEEIDELKTKLKHVAVHVNNQNSDNTDTIRRLQADVEKLKKVKQVNNNREMLRQTIIEEKPLTPVKSRLDVLDDDNDDLLPIPAKKKPQPKQTGGKQEKIPPIDLLFGNTDNENEEDDEDIDGLLRSKTSE